MEKIKNKKLKLKKRVLIVIFILFLLSFLIVFSKFSIMGISLYKTNSMINKVINEIDDKVSIEIPDVEKKTEDEGSNIIYTKDFDKLKEMNSEVVGWLDIVQTNVEYPVVQTTNNTYYLNHSFDKSKNVNGWVFMNFFSNQDMSDQNTIIFAHNSLFKVLREIYNGKYGNEIDIRFYQSNQVNTYKVYTVYKVPNNEIRNINTSMSDDLIEEFSSMSNVNFNIKATGEDKILTLSTCYNDSKERIIVQAKLIR